MDTQTFTQLKAARTNMLKVVASLSPDQLNRIPEGFNNNLVWHLGHVIVTQQLLCYKLAGEDLQIPNEWVDQFRKGTKPEGMVKPEDIELLKERLLTIIPGTEADVKAGKFKTFQRYETSFGLTLHNAKEAFAFNNLHESLHLGYMMAQRRLLANLSNL